MSAPSISAVIPCAGMARYLGDAVGSIRKQRIAVTEIVVVRPEDDQDTARRCEELGDGGAPIKCLTVGEPGPAAARNVGIGASQGDIIAFLDADDLWLPDKLDLQIGRLERDPMVDLVGGHAILFDRLDPDTLAPSEDSRVHHQLWSSLGMVICRRTVFDRVGMLDETYRYAEDVDFLLRVRDAGIPFTILREPVFYYRQHRNSMMRADDSRRTTDLHRAMLGSVRRRRKLGLPPAKEQFLVGQFEPDTEASEGGQ